MATRSLWSSVVLRRSVSNEIGQGHCEVTRSRIQIIASVGRSSSAQRKQLIRKISDLDEANDRLRDVLVRFRKSSAELAALVERGDSVREAVGFEIPQRRRRELTATLDQFEGARQEFRLALFALCMEEGASMSEIARAFGISRQRASVLAGQAAKRFVDSETLA
jgi:transposase-like protein